VKTEKLADNHYKRVTNFAKEMLVWPEEITVHKIKNPKFLSDVKPTATVPPLNVAQAANAAANAGSRNSMEFSRRGAAASTQRIPVVQQPPMKFNF